MKNMMAGLCILVSLQGIAQTNYWQQYLRFQINVQLDPKEKRLTADETIVYKNNSPQSLDFIWFHLYPNAYKNDETKLFQQIKNDRQKQDRFPSYKSGYISDVSFTVNGMPARTEAHPDKNEIDIIKLILPQPLQPNDSVVIATPFTVQLPSYFSRSGYSGNEFMVCQWYPKPAVYDKNGWHEMPYLDMGEFYSEYASYDVNITVPSAFVVGATGTLKSEDELTVYKSIGAYNATHCSEKPKLYQPSTTQAVKQLSYRIDSVPDFAWFADPGFVIEYDTACLPSGKITDVFAYHYNTNKSIPWRKSTDYIKDAVQHYSRWVGEYAYPVAQAVEGPKNNAAGGMEYPTITLITAANASPETLDNMITHEVGHNWFMSMLGTNERDHAWMDEGLNSYFEFRYMAEKYRTNLMLDDMIPEDLKKASEDSFEYAVYKALLQLPTHNAIETPSADFDGSQNYALTVYVKAAGWMYLLQNTVGREKVDEGFHHYFALWKNKHPQPEDFKAALEETIHGSLHGFFALLARAGKLTE